MQESAIRRMGAILAQNRDLISFAPGYPAPETFPWSDFSDIARELLSGSHGSALQYGATRGFRPLLEMISGIMQGRGIASSMDRLLVTTGSQQGLDLVAQGAARSRRCRAGRAARLHRSDHRVPKRARAHGRRAAGIGRNRPGGARRHPPTPGEKWPPGSVPVCRAEFPESHGSAVESSQTACNCVDWAATRNVLIVEDDPYRDLYFEDSATEADVRPIKADDRDGRVIYLSSFSKTLAPGFRVAWIDAPAPIAVKLEMAKQAGDLCTGVFDQRMVHECIRRGILARQLPLLRKHYADKRDVMVAACRRESADALSLDRSAGRILPVGDSATRDGCRSPARSGRDAWRGVRGGQRVLRQRSRRQPRSAFVFRSDARPDSRRGSPSRRSYS